MSEGYVCVCGEKIKCDTNTLAKQIKQQNKRACYCKNLIPEKMTQIFSFLIACFFFFFFFVPEHIAMFKW